MIVTVLGSGAVGSLVGGLLAARGHAVYFARGKTELRILLPDRWLLSKIHAATGRHPDILLVALARHHLRLLKKEEIKKLVDGESTEVVLCNCDPSEPERLGIGAHSFLVTLMDAVKLQANDVELVSRRSAVLAEKATAAESIAKEMAHFGVSFHAVEDAGYCLNSLFVYQLIDLAVSLCNTTRENFLSFPEGRKVAAGLLREGIKAMDKGGKPLARLPLMDPKELLSRLEKDAKNPGGGRHDPGRAFPPTLQDFLLGKPAEMRELNKRAVELGGAVGLELPMNWRLFQKAGRAASIGYYRDPVELSDALK